MPQLEALARFGPEPRLQLFPIVCRLEIEPKTRSCLKVPPEPNSCIRCNCTARVNNFGNTGGGNVEGHCQVVRRKPGWFHEVLTKYLAGMNRRQLGGGPLGHDFSASLRLRGDLSFRPGYSFDPRRVSFQFRRFWQSWHFGNSTLAPNG